VFDLGGGEFKEDTAADGGEGELNPMTESVLEELQGVDVEDTSPVELLSRVQEGTVVPDDDLDAGGTAALVIASGPRYFSPTTSEPDAPRRRPTSRSTAPSVSSFSRTLAARSTGRPPSTGCERSRPRRVCS
jgi:hypothetical protein